MGYLPGSEMAHCPREDGGMGHLPDSRHNKVQVPAEEVVEHLLMGSMRGVLVGHPHGSEPATCFHNGRAALAKAGIVLELQHLPLLSALIGVTTTMQMTAMVEHGGHLG